MQSAVLGYLSLALVVVNVGFAAFVGAAPQGTIPWWATAGLAALNAIVHALPSQGISVVSGSTKPTAPPPGP